MDTGCNRKKKGSQCHFAHLKESLGGSRVIVINVFGLTTNVDAVSYGNWDEYEVKTSVSAHGERQEVVSIAAKEMTST